MTQTKPDMTALDYTHAAHKQLAAGNERKAAGLLWKAAEATFLDIARARGIECNGNLTALAKALDADGSRSKWYYRGSLGGAWLLHDHAEFEALEKWELMDSYEATLEFVLEAHDGKR